MRKLFLFLLLFSFSGCAFAPFLITPIVTGVIMWVGGEAHKYYAADPGRMYRSAKAALNELGIPISVDESRPDGYHISAGENNRLSITIKKVDSKITLVSMRVNFMGDKPFAELVYKAIDAQADIIEFSPEGHPVKNKSGRR